MAEHGGGTQDVTGPRVQAGQRPGDRRPDAVPGWVGGTAVHVVSDGVPQVQRMATGQLVQGPQVVGVQVRPAPGPDEVLGLGEVERTEPDHGRVAVPPRRIGAGRPAGEQQHQWVPRQRTCHESGQQRRARVGGVRVVDDHQYR
jgi:hypothetical protein